MEQTLANKQQIEGSYTFLEVNKGRFERREVYISRNLSGISAEWLGLKEIIKVKRWVKHKGKISEETAYFISSQNAHALHYYVGIRSHWAIENSLHYVKDVTLKEDQSKIRTRQAPEKISTLKNICLNIFRQNGYEGMEEAKILLCSNICKYPNSSNRTQQPALWRACSKLFKLCVN